MKRLFAVGIVVALFAGAAIAGGYYLLRQHILGPGEPGAPVRVEITSGQTGASIGKTLAERDLVRHEALFRLAIRMDGTESVIRRGVYDLPKGLAPMEILHLLYEGPNVALSPDDLAPDRVVTVPEGLTVAQTAQLFPNPDAFLAATELDAFRARLGIEAESLEGFLMPNTYYLDADDDEAAIVARMVEQFETEYQRLIAEWPAPDLPDKFTTVTIASLIEEEARLERERALISAVIYNRLENNMRLEFDATLQYVLNKYGQRLLNGDKEIDSPYNTYKVRGLPPGPISNPGVASLQAALYPADADYLYFVSNADGKTHTFSTTLREHTEAVRKYRRDIARQRRELRSEGR